MISFDKLKASNAFGLEFVNITFSIEDTSENINDYRFDLYKSPIETSNFELLQSNIKNFEFNDYDVNLQLKERRQYYKVKAIKLSTGDFIWSDSFSHPYTPGDNYTSWFKEVYTQYLNIVSNKEMLLLKRIRHGQLCDCYDEVRGQSRLAEKCTSCYGTGYANGFYPPAKIKVNFYNAKGSSEAFEVTGSSEQETNLQLWTNNYPLIQEGDLLIDGLTGERNVVMTVQPSVKNGFIIRQVLQLDEVPEASIYYKIPVE